MASPTPPPTHHGLLEVLASLPGAVWAAIVTAVGVIVAATVTGIVNLVSGKKTLDARMIEIADSRMKALSESQAKVIDELQAVVAAKDAQIDKLASELEAAQAALIQANMALKSATASLKAEKRRTAALERAIAKTANLEQENATLRAEIAHLKSYIETTGAYYAKEVDKRVDGAVAEAFGEAAKEHAVAVVQHPERFLP